MDPRYFENKRRVMVSEHLARRDVTHPGVLAAMGKIPRERFVPLEYREHAYDDGPLGIGEHQTISQPYIVGFMTQALNPQPGQKALEIGTGSGYQAAILGELYRDVYSVERHPSLSKSAGTLLRQLGYNNIHLKIDDGTLGWPEQGPYDAIIVTAASPDLPHPLVDQLAEGGCLVIPVGGEEFQELLRVRKTPQGIARESLGEVRFVPLIGKHGWPHPGL